MSVAQAASRQGDNQQRQRPTADHKVQIAAEHAGSGEELNQGRTIEGIPGRVYQYGHKHATVRVVEDPHDDETEGDEGDGKHNEVEDGTPRRYIRKILGWDQEPRQVPESPETPQDEASDQRTMQPLQAGLRETAPPRFLEQWSSDENHENESTEIGQHGQRGERLERFQGPRPDDRAEHHNHRETYKSEQVPPKPDPPPHDPAQPTAYARPPFGYRGHDKSGRNRTQQTSDSQQAYYLAT